MGTIFRNSHKIDLSSEVVQRNLLSKKVRLGSGNETRKERKQKI